MPTATPQASTRLAEIRADVARRVRLPDGIDEERNQLRASVESAKQDLRDYYAAETKSEARERKLKDNLAQAEAALDQPWAERTEAARTVARKAPAEAERFMVERFNDLTAEHREKCAALRDDVVRAIEDAEALHGELRAALTEWRQLLRASPGDFAAEANRVDRQISSNDERLTHGFHVLRRGLEGWTPLAPVDQVLGRIRAETERGETR